MHLPQLASTPAWPERTWYPPTAGLQPANSWPAAQPGVLPPAARQPGCAVRGVRSRPLNGGSRTCLVVLLRRSSQSWLLRLPCAPTLAAVEADGHGRGVHAVGSVAAMLPSTTAHRFTCAWCYNNCVDAGQLAQPAALQHATVGRSLSAAVVLRAAGRRRPALTTHTCHPGGSANTNMVAQPA